MPGALVAGFASIEAESLEDLALHGRCERDWLGGFLEPPNGIPPHDTFRRVPMLSAAAWYRAPCR
jgi:hypothetical protein